MIDGYMHCVMCREEKEPEQLKFYLMDYDKTGHAMCSECIAAESDPDKMYYWIPVSKEIYDICAVMEKLGRPIPDWG